MAKARASTAPAQLLFSLLYSSSAHVSLRTVSRALELLFVIAAAAATAATIAVGSAAVDTDAAKGSATNTAKAASAPADDDDAGGASVAEAANDADGRGSTAALSGGAGGDSSTSAAPAVPDSLDLMLGAAAAAAHPFDEPPLAVVIQLIARCDEIELRLNALTLLNCLLSIASNSSRRRSARRSERAASDTARPAAGIGGARCRLSALCPMPLWHWRRAMSSLCLVPYAALALAARDVVSLPCALCRSYAAVCALSRRRAHFVPYTRACSPPRLLDSLAPRENHPGSRMR